jgi:hypothetical protein
VLHIIQGGAAWDGRYDKKIKLNKVVIYNSYFYDTTKNYLNWDWYGRSGEGAFEAVLGMHMGLGVGWSGCLNAYGTLGRAPGLAYYPNDIYLVGSIYSCDNLDLAKSTSMMNMYSGEYNYVYASSFRYWKKDKPLTSGPPPHIPMDIRVEWIGLGNVLAGEKFFTELKKVLDGNLDYTPELASSINDLLTIVEK